MSVIGRWCCRHHLVVLSGWPRRSPCTRSSCAPCWYRRRCTCSATPTGGCPARSTACSRAWPSNPQRAWPPNSPRSEMPEIIFRDGPARRRAVVIGGPDIWEVIVAVRNAPERGDELLLMWLNRTQPHVSEVAKSVLRHAKTPRLARLSLLSRTPTRWFTRLSPGSW
jgi:hypothetical protein